jgi:hypothetical protein
MTLPQKEEAPFSTLHLQEGTSHSYHLMIYACLGLWYRSPCSLQWVTAYKTGWNLMQGPYSTKAWPLWLYVSCESSQTMGRCVWVCCVFWSGRALCQVWQTRTCLTEGQQSQQMPWGLQEKPSYQLQIMYFYMQFWTLEFWTLESRLQVPIEV